MVLNIQLRLGLVRGVATKLAAKKPTQVSSPTKYSMTNISVTTYPRILKPKLYVFSHQGESKSIVKSPENSIFQALAIGFHWFFKLFFYNGFLWEIFFSESDIS
jgi:hypothetical protein